MRHLLLVPSRRVLGRVSKGLSADASLHSPSRRPQKPGPPQDERRIVCWAIQVEFPVHGLANPSARPEEADRR